jgi:type I restriction enzyme S subunit
MAWQTFWAASSASRENTGKLLESEFKTLISHRLNEPKDWLDKSKWKRVRLDDVVFRDTSKVEPKIDDVTRWVGADHIDENDVDVTRWGHTSDSLFPPTFKFTFKAGHVLLHSRNPNKVCVPRFDGITGEKLFILKPKDKGVLLADFLPFLLRSERFKAWAKQWASGSVNKFLNWSALANYEFDLPPLDQQRRIAEILWNTNSNLKAQENLGSSIESARKRYLAHLTANGRSAALDDQINKDGWKLAKLEQCVEFLDGLRKPVKESDRSKR